MKRENELVKKAMEAKEKAYAPYSKFKVGAAVLTESGEIFTGANVENSSYGATICAERIAVLKAVLDGFREIKAIAISSDSDELIFPCGICRQVIFEFGKIDTIILCSDNRGNFETHTLGELLPYAFKLKEDKNTNGV